MSEPTLPIPSNVAPARTRPHVEAAIARAARATGTDFSYLLAQAKIESGLNPAARAPTSSAAGLYQFTGSTWRATLARHGDEHGLGWAAAAALSNDPAARAQALALRFDPEASAAMAGELAGDNALALRRALGREPDASELYLAHFLGGEGAGRFLTALVIDPAQSAVALLPKAAGANRAIFFDAQGPRSVGAVMAVLRGKVESAMGGSVSPTAIPSSPAGRGWGWGIDARSSAEPPPQSRPPREGIPAARRPSMAETLATTFGGSADAPAPVRAAYGQLRAFGL